MLMIWLDSLKLLDQKHCGYEISKFLLLKRNTKNLSSSTHKFEEIHFAVPYWERGWEFNCWVVLQGQVSEKSYMTCHIPFQVFFIVPNIVKVHNIIKWVQMFSKAFLGLASRQLRQGTYRTLLGVDFWAENLMLFTPFSVGKSWWDKDKGFRIFARWLRVLWKAGSIIALLLTCALVNSI